MEIFSFDDYKVWLLKSLRDGKMKNGQQTALAKTIGCRPGYISRILNEDADLSLEQASDVADFFALGSLDKSYLLALVGEKRAVKNSLKTYWKKKKQEAYEASQELKNRVPLEKHLNDAEMMIYYSSWHYSAIHIAVGVPQLQTADALATYFQVSKSQTVKILKFLSDVNLIQKEGARFIPHKNKMHLDKNSPLLQNHHLNWKHKTIETMQDRRPSDLNYMSVMSLSRKDYQNLRELLLNFIQSGHRLIEKSKDEIVAYCAIDLFPLHRESEEENDKRKV